MNRTKRGCFALASLFTLARLYGQIQNQPDDGQWVMAAKNYASTRFSTLDQINTGNVKNLKTRLDLFDRGDTRARGGAIGSEQHDVYRDAMAELFVCARSDKARRPDEMGLSAEPFAGLARGCML